MDKVIQFYIAYTDLLNTVKDNRSRAKGNGKNYLQSENYQAYLKCLCRERKKKKTSCNTSINPQRLHFKAFLY